MTKLLNQCPGASQAATRSAKSCICIREAHHNARSRCCPDSGGLPCEAPRQLLVCRSPALVPLTAETPLEHHHCRRDTNHWSLPRVLVCLARSRSDVKAVGAAEGFHQCVPCPTPHHRRASQHRFRIREVGQECRIAPSRPSSMADGFSMSTRVPDVERAPTEKDTRLRRR